MAVRRARRERITQYYRVIRALLVVLVVLVACSSGHSSGRSGSSLGNVIPIDQPASLQNPCWSPSGDQLAFTRFRDGYNDGDSDVVVARSDGTAPRPVTTADANNVNLPGSCWDRSGHIAYSTDGADGDEIWTASTTGPPVRLADPSDRSAWEPSFSPDGQWVAFEGHNHDGTDGGTIWKVRRDGSGLTQLTRGADDREPNWSPRGDRIVFQSKRSGNWDIWTIGAAGGPPHPITTDPSEDTDPSWSPDGRRIVYSSSAGRDLAGLFVITPGGAPVELHAVPDTAYAGAPSWSPDGRRIAFETCTGDPDGSAGTHIAVVQAPAG